MPTTDVPAPGSAGTPRCLLVTKEFSASPTSGGTLRTLAILETLSTRYDTTVVSPDGVVSKGPGRPLEEHPGRASGGDVLRQVRTAVRYKSLSGLRTGGSKLLDNLWNGAEGRYDVAIIDHTALAGLADEVAAGADTVVVSMHNIESDLMNQRARLATSAKDKVAMSAEVRLLRHLEAHVADRYPVMVCTEADARALNPKRGRIVCRNGIFAGQVTPSGNRPANSMVFSGALDWEPNIDGIVWFSEKVWPLIRAQIPDATVTIAGRNPGKAVTQACSPDGITLLANPPVMATVLDAHVLGIVPLLSGGGSRIKILEYLAAGIDIVSTDVGASGLEDIPSELVDRLKIDPQLFADTVVARLRSPRDTSALAQDWVRKHYSWDVTLQPLLDFLER
ncbi:glycosyltransferase [Kineosporia sp. J2-2]|uniref:Glycosyltransferase n=1 Tax=Kineosporia corallincola TaxID=2835133 RepID=A0ABS5T8S2_9ACTN|nr:glycosyltransferase [Kineosporia corallincola]MBT0767432.1 glycosyltransferase [Kineosporia corallincola]